jgi:hypothetical protein
MKYLIAAIAVCLSTCGAYAAESTGAKVGADAKAMAHEAKDAAVDVGKQIGQGTKKAYKSTKSKIKGDVDAGKPGDGNLAAKNKKMNTSKDGRE